MRINHFSDPEDVKLNSSQLAKLYCIEPRAKILFLDFRSKVVNQSSITCTYKLNSIKLPPIKPPPLPTPHTSFIAIIAHKSSPFIFLSSKFSRGISLKLVKHATGKNSKKISLLIRREVKKSSYRFSLPEKTTCSLRIV